MIATAADAAPTNPSQAGGKIAEYSALGPTSKATAVTTATSAAATSRGTGEGTEGRGAMGADAGFEMKVSMSLIVRRGRSSERPPQVAVHAT
jgi:hypothetical protein